MKFSNAFAAALLGLAAAGSATAATVTVGGTSLAGQGQVSSQPGVALINFNVGSVLPAGVTMTGAASNLVTGSLANQYASPPGNTSQYLSVSPSAGTPVTITLSTPANYIGFYAGSVDVYNLIEFLSASNTVVASYTGTQLATLAGVPADGGQGNGFYFNVFETGNTFTSARLSSSLNAFELDNFAIGVAAPPQNQVPLPGTLPLVGLALLGVAMMSRKNAKQ